MQLAMPALHQLGDHVSRAVIVIDRRTEQKFHLLLRRLRLEPLNIMLGQLGVVRWNGLAREFNWAIRLFTGLLRPRKASDPESACKHSGLKCGARWRRRSLSLVLHRASVS